MGLIITQAVPEDQEIRSPREHVQENSPGRALMNTNNKEQAEKGKLKGETRVRVK